MRRTCSAGSADPGAARVRPGASRSPPPRPAAPRGGFVLMEILPALVILGLIVLVAYPALPRGTGSARMLALAVESAAILRQARTEAIASGREATAVFDARRRMLVQGGSTLTLPADVDMSILSSETCPKETDRVAILFRPDGTSCGGVVRFAKGTRAFRLRVNWATGNVAIVDGG